MKYICKKFINHQIKKCLLFRCRHAVVIMQTLNCTNQCSLFMTVRHIFEISEDDHPSLVTDARANWWTLDFANAFVSPGVNSRGELVPSHGASRRRLGDKRILLERGLPYTLKSPNEQLMQTFLHFIVSLQSIFYTLGLIFVFDVNIYSSSLKLFKMDPVVK
jgi:hypothetical protein